MIYVKKQILLIHGGTAFSDYNTFLAYLRMKPIDDPLGLEHRKKWKDNFKEIMSGEYEVFFPSMPNSQNAKYTEWKIWFERHCAFLRDGVIVIGHSLGGYFLAKYLTENILPVRISALYLLAAPFKSDDFGGEDGGDFVFAAGNLPKLERQTKAVYIFHSKDDPAVPFSHAEAYVQNVSGATLISFKDKGHFLMETFPELIDHIQQQSV